MKMNIFGALLVSGATTGFQCRGAFEMQIDQFQPHFAPDVSYELCGVCDEGGVVIVDLTRHRTKRELQEQIADFLLQVEEHRKGALEWARPDGNREARSPSNRRRFCPSFCTISNTTRRRAQLCLASQRTEFPCQSIRPGDRRSGRSRCRPVTRSWIFGEMATLMYANQHYLGNSLSIDLLDEYQNRAG